MDFFRFAIVDFSGNRKIVICGQCPRTMAHRAGVFSGTPGQRPVTFLRSKSDFPSNNGVQKRTELYPGVYRRQTSRARIGVKRPALQITICLLAGQI